MESDSELRVMNIPMEEFHGFFRKLRNSSQKSKITLIESIELYI